MNRMQEQVERFMLVMGQTVAAEPYQFSERELRAKLIMEEAVETVAAMGYHVTAQINEPTCDPRVTVAEFEKLHHELDEEEVIDGICDLLYVAFGAGVSMGIDIEPHFAEVHRANMEKTTGPKREDGKQLKPEGWKPPNHDRVRRLVEDRWALWQSIATTEAESA